MKPTQADKHYFGNVALTYDDERRSNFLRRYKWEAEFKSLAKALDHLPKNSTILDAPCGTGRFFPLMQHRFFLYGCDISPDMLKNIPQGTLEKIKGLHVAQIGRLPFDDQQFDHVVCMRFFNLFKTHEAYELLGDLLRVAKESVIVQVRFSNLAYSKVLDAYRFLQRAKAGFRNTYSGAPETASFPRRHQFELFVDSAGFTVERYIPIISVIDSQRVCVLTRKR